MEERPQHGANFTLKMEAEDQSCLGSMRGQCMVIQEDKIESEEEEEEEEDDHFDNKGPMT